MKTRYVLILLLFTLSACGFHLRGSQHRAEVKVAKIYVTTLDADTVAAAVKSRLQQTGAKAVASTDKAEFTLKLENENFNQTVLSVSAETGKVQEYELTLTVYLSVTDRKGGELLVAEPIILARDYTFDESAVLGKITERNLLRKELAQQAAEQILRRLRAVTRAT